MCGIAGFTHLGRAVDPERIRRATMTLVHRGPDEQSVYNSPDASLGAVRLKIIDLSSGQQPMATDDGSAVVAFNGEIYNHAELRRELESLGHRFHSRCDTEVVLRGFLQWDIGCLQRLRGMFALAFWQPAQKRLVLARDRMGIKPLYFHRRGRDLYFGSELKALFEHPEIERRLNLEGLNYFLSLNYVPCPYTLVEGIEKLPPGNWLEWREGEIRTDAYWRLEFHPRLNLKFPAALEELDTLLGDSMREHLISDVPLGVWASGGLDSSTILHYAARASTSRLKTFSVSFQGRSFDESRYFRLVAEKYGTEHCEFDLNPDVEMAPAIEQLAYYSDEPSADAGALPVWFLSRMSRQHVTVALSGEGADEIFGGYYTYLADRLARPLRAIPAPLRRAALAALRLWPVSNDKISLEYKLKRFLGGSLLSPDAAHFFWNGTLTADEKRELCGNGPWTAADPLALRLPPEAGQVGFVNRYLWLDQLFYLPDDILCKCDRMSMAHSLEVRPPFLDHRIVEFAASLPGNFKVHGFRLKHILKELMRDKLPAPILTRRKEGFDIPTHDWFRGVLRPVLLDALSPHAVHNTGLFRWEAIDTLLRTHFEKRANLGYHLWGLLTLFLWMKRWKIETSPKAAREHALVG
jgi:asparagine synthase (glutamine-hydrolysing)